MSTTFGVLKTEVSEALRDPENLTFSDGDVGRIINMAVVELGRIMPRQFAEVITPVADTLTYTVLEDDFGGDATPEIEIARVELWDGTTTPASRKYLIDPASAGYRNDSEVGWSMWGGVLSIPRRIQQYMAGVEENYQLKVWGYSPYPELVDDEDLLEVSTEGKYAVTQCAHMNALRRLIGERELFSQWQTRSGNTDTTLAGLIGDYNTVRDEWRRTKHELYRPRVRV